MKYLRDYIEEIISEDQQAAQEAWDQRVRAVGAPRLHPSSLGGCKRAAILSAVKPFPDHPLYADETHPFDLYTQSVMLSGNVWESVISDSLWDHLSELAKSEAFVPSVRNSTDTWAWELDGLIRPGKLADFPGGLIVELKDTAEYNFKVKDRLPYRHHLCQVIAYQRLQEQVTGTLFPVRIYYNGRGQWAEFDVRTFEGTIHYTGLVNGRDREGKLEHDVYAEMDELDAWWEQQALPPTYDSPFEVSFGCCRGSNKKGWYPSCRWYGYCWPNMPQKGPLDGDF